MRRRFIALLFGLALSSAAAPVLAAAAAPAAPAVVRFQDYPGLGNLLIRVAASKGYCAQEGLVCKLTMIPAAPLGLQALIGGSIDVAMTPVEVVAEAVMRGSRLRAVVGAAVTNINEVAVAASLPMPHQGQGYPAEMQDLKGRRVGVTSRGSAAESFFSFLLEQAGMRADDVTYVAVGAPNTAFAALRAGQVDAIVSWEPAGVMCELTKQCRMVFRSATAPKPDLLKAMNGAGADLVMRADEVDRQPAIAQALARISKRAADFVNDPANKAEVLKISAGYFAFDMPQGDLIARRTLEQALELHTYSPVVSRAAVQATLAYLKQTKRLAAVPALADIVWPQAPGR
ncbi:MAG: ABC transporter substrate-binding protein [Burkholderiales bacterium]|nr:ABC transporter substrate-binding protein [Burkholderiales bacterium]